MIAARLLVSTVGAVAVLAVPVVTPVQAAPAPVTPRLQTIEFALASNATLPPGEAATASPAADTLQSEQMHVEDFSLVGVSWAQDSGVGADELRVEVRTDDGSGWSDWALLPGVDEGPDAGTEEAAGAVTTATSPLWVGEASAVQTRVTPVPAEASTDDVVELPDSLQVNLVDPGTSAADGNVATEPLATADAGTAAPAYVTRAQWGADESKKNCAASYNSTVKAAVVHHTAGGNSYSTQAQAMQQLRADYAYHTDVLGWCDLGYNVVVDKFGTVYEGRAGGLDKAVSGAHAGGFNADTFGISALGNYSVAAAPAAMVNAITRVVAWKLGLYDRDPEGTVVLTSAGGGTSRYPAGKEVTLDVVSGHRDVGLTECPGKYLYTQLDTVRAGAADLLVPPQKHSLARTSTDPRVWVTSDTQKFPVHDLPAYSALSKLGPLAYVTSSELSRRVNGPGFGRFAVGADSKVWHIDGGRRSYVGSCDLVWAFGQHCSSIPTLTAEQTAVFPEGPGLQVFVKSRTADSVYVMWGGQKRPVTRWSDLVAVNGGRAPSISVLEPETVAAFPVGPRMLPPGTMVKSPTEARVVVVDGNHRSVPLETFSAASALGLGGLEVVDAGAMAAYPAWTGFLVPTLRCPGGAFVGVAGTLRPVSEAVATGIGSSVWLPVDGATCSALRASTATTAFGGPLLVKADSSPRVYLVAGGVKRPVTSWSRLEALAGTSSPVIVPFADTPLSKLPTGPDA